MSGQCSAPGCEREAKAKGLCMMHYKRQWRGKPVSQPEVGDPSGHGLWGVMDRGEHDVLCHECGRRYASVGAHAQRVHGMSAREYRLAHGIPSQMPLVSLELARRTSGHSRDRLGSDGWRRLEAARDPEAASHARDETAFRRIGMEAESRRNGSTRPARTHPCRICGAPMTGRRQACSEECRHTLRVQASRRSM